MREYDEQRALMTYVWRNYPELVRPHQCLPSSEAIRDALPADARDAYWQHTLECRRIVADSIAEDVRESRNGYIVHMTPMLPQLSPELLELVTPITERLEIEAFWEMFRPHQSQVSINRCPECSRILINEKTRQCLSCGHDWH
ncbi:hypothetical protein [Bremerella sp. P1]|uniref:hypothetical protein n=1 Tax=Bremerella sp. P1 TaxID=3026424 RepID=UPI002368B483|nr:hypothetical protein [Bremerella sp. P1]WDI42184.1 hypothetical protein PSR63_27415 [Bremerella sp. P1]